MTNDLIEPVLAALGSSNDMQFPVIVCDGGPMWPSLVMMAWMLLVIAAPLLSLVLCIRAWRRHKRGQTAPFTRRVMLVASLLTVTTTGIHVLVGLREAFFLAGTSVMGAAQKAMISMVVANECTILMIGCTACSVCLLCALVLPVTKPSKGHADQASDAAQKVASSTDSRCN